MSSQSDETPTETSMPSPSPSYGLLALYHRIPLYARIVIALLIGVVLGVTMGKEAGSLKQVSSLMIDLLKALATPLILLAILHAILSARVTGKTARKMVFLLATNTLVAILIGIVVANIIQPGHWAPLPPPAEHTTRAPYNALEDFKSKIPTNIVKPLYDDNVIAVIILAIVFGFALRKVRADQVAAGQTGYKAVEDFVETAFKAVMTALLWLVELIPIAVLCSVAANVGTKGFEPFKALGGFIVAVLTALLLQACFYLLRVRTFSWVSPSRFLSGGRDALISAFSSASSTATMPLTYAALRKKVGVREESANMGALVGSNFNNDGTALYEALAPLFIAQALGMGLGLGQQFIVAFMAVVASIGAAGIPEAGLVTMLLVFKSVHLPLDYVLLLLPVDWFLDRCRTMVNVMGDMSVACLLDGKTPKSADESEG